MPPHARARQGLSIERLNPKIGAMILGIDLTAPLQHEVLDALNEAWMEYLVLVFPNQRITDE